MVITHHVMLIALIKTLTDYDMINHAVTQVSVVTPAGMCYDLTI